MFRRDFDAMESSEEFGEVNTAPVVLQQSDVSEIVKGSSLLLRALRSALLHACRLESQFGAARQ